MGGVFVNYRSRNSDWAAERLHEALIARFGKRRVFLDDKVVRPGQSFPDGISAGLRDCEVLLTVIGHDWLTTPSSGGLTIHAEHDWVRVEIAGALAAGLHVIPVYLDGAARLRADQLPDDIATLATLRGLDLRRGDLRDHVARIVTTVAEHVQVPRCPYPGVEPFGEADAPFFFGRRDETDQLVRLVERNPVVVVVGPSGAGKSSLIHAGLLPRLRVDHVPLRLVPGRTPHELVTGAAAHRRSPDAELVLVVDQFEELVAQDAAAATELFERVHDLTTRDALVKAVFTLRWSDVDKLVTPPLVPVLDHAKLFLQPLSDDAIVEAIERPAEVAGGFSLAPGLVKTIIREAGDAPGRQHLVAFALTRLWHEGNDGELTHEAYAAMGGVLGAISAHAESVYEQQDEADRKTCQRLLTQLVRPSEDNGFVMSPVRLDRLDESLRTMAEKLSFGAGGRLVVIRRDNSSDPEIVALAHAALAQEWKTLQTWLTLDREFRTWESGLRTNHASNAVLRGAALTEARDWLSRRGEDIAATDKVYIRGNLSRRTRIRAGLALVLAMVLLFGVGALVAARTAFELRDRAVSEAVAGRAADLSKVYPSAAALLSLAAYRLSDTHRARSNVLNAFANPFAVRLPGIDDQVDSVAVNHDTTIVATASRDRRVRLWDVRDPYRPRGLDEVVTEDAVRSVAFSPDGRTLAVGGASRTTSLLDVTDPRDVTESHELFGHTNHVLSVAYGPAGGVRQLLATAGGDDITILWDVTDPDEPAELSRLTGHRDDVSSVAISPDGRTVATASWDRTVGLWDLTDPGAPVALPALRHPGRVFSVSFGPDGRTLATAGDETIRLWDVADPGRPAQAHVLDQPGQQVAATAFSPDGDTLATTRRDGNVSLWNVTDPRKPAFRAEYPGHAGEVNAVVFAPDGTKLVTGSHDRTARVWDLPPPTLRDHTGIVFTTAYDPTGTLLATAGQDRTARLWDVTSPHRPRRLAVLSGHRGNVDAAVFGPNGTVLATVSFDGTAILWDVTDPRRPRRLAGVTNGSRAGLMTAAFTADGAILATGDHRGTVRLWDVRDPREPVQLGAMDDHAGPITMLTTSVGPDETRIAAVLSDNGSTQLWDITDPGAPTALDTLPPHEGKTWTLAVSPDGRTLATGSHDRAIRFWDITDPAAARPLGELVSNHRPVHTIAFSPDGKTLASGGLDGTVDLVNVGDPDHPTYRAMLVGHADGVEGIAFAPDGHTLATADADGTVRFRELDIERVADRICAVAPPLSRAEWGDYAPDMTFSPPCP